MSKQQAPKKGSERISVGLDIGTSKICALVASHGEEPNSLNILGIGLAENQGSNRGVIINIEKTTKTLLNVIEQAEKQSGVKITEVTVGIAGDHIKSFEAREVIGISDSSKEISKADIERVIEKSRNVVLPEGQRVLHVIPQEFILDGQDGIYDPIGMSGTRLEALVLIITGLNTAIQNIYKCVERVGLRIKNIVLEPIASSYAVLDEEEKEAGVALIDIGGGTTDITIFEEKVIRFTKVIALAGKQVTNDIRQCFGIINSQAEWIKKQYGYAYLPSIIEDELFMIPGIGGRKPTEVRSSDLCKVIQPRMEEIFEFALNEIRNSGLASRLGAGVVITGGCSLLRGIEDLALEVFGMSVKIGIPMGITYSGLATEIQSPIFSTVVGLALMDAQENNLLKEELFEQKKKKLSIFKKIKNFLEEL